jgi:hypothetical protein
VAGRENFRCIGCGTVVSIEMPTDRHVITLRPDERSPFKPATPTCISCNGRNWVKVGSMTEFYRWTDRADVCSVGQHRAESAQRYTLYPRERPDADQTPAAPNPLEVVRLVVTACPDHLDELATRGFRGFFLRAPDDIE